MGKRLFCMLLAFLLLLCGCGDAAADTTASTIDLESNIYHQEVMKQIYKAPAYEGELKIPYDPNRQVYISLSNQDCDFYPGYGFVGVMFWVITREHYDPSQIQAYVDSQTEYEVTVADMTEYCNVPSHSSDYKLYGLQKYQYICMQGVDWEELTNQAIYDITANRLALQYDKESEEYAGYMALSSGHIALMQRYENEYQAVTQADIPQFSAYRVSINFTGLGSHEETVETVELEIGGKSYTLDLGQWRLHNTLPQVITQVITDCDTAAGLHERASGRLALPDSTYYDGYECIPGMFYFAAEEDLTLKGIRQLETAGQALDVIGAKINVYDEKWEKVVTEYFWDPSQTLEIAESTNVRIDLYVRDERFELYEVCLTAYFFLDYTVRGKDHAIATPCLLNRIHDNVWDTYLMAFEGIDMGEYYTCYFATVVNNWLKELPEGWLN